MVFDIHLRALCFFERRVSQKCFFLLIKSFIGKKNYDSCCVTPVIESDSVSFK